MTEPFCVDPASAAITAVIDSMKVVFAPDSSCPPIGGGSTVVHFIPGEGDVWDPLANEGADCDDPFLWVRLASRYRSEMFPESSILLSPCGDMEVIVVELGVGRCVSMEDGIDWNVNAREAEIGLDDSWRLGRAMCRMAGWAKENHQRIGFDTITPGGPEGGGIAWMTIVYIGFVT